MKLHTSIHIALCVATLPIAAWPEEPAGDAPLMFEGHARSASGDETPQYGTGFDREAPSDAPSAPTGPPPSGASMTHHIARALETLSSEPSLQELEQAALRYADAHPSATKNWRRASKSAAALPTLKVSADLDVGRDEELDRYQDRPDRWGADTDRGYGIDMSVQWKLDELVFNPDELKVYDALADRALRRESLLSTLIGYYFERRRLQLETLLLPPTDIEEALDRHLRIQELTAVIDALTDGRLSSKLKGGKNNP